MTDIQHLREEDTAQLTRLLLNQVNAASAAVQTEDQVEAFIRHIETWYPKDDVKPILRDASQRLSLLLGHSIGPNV